MGEDRLEWKKISLLGRVAYIITFIALAVVLVWVVKVKNTYQIVMVITDSMEPAVMVNSLSVLDKGSIQGVEVGDIVMYKSPSGFNVTHRVVGVDTESGGVKLSTKGDNNDFIDNVTIDEDNFLGRIVATNNSIAKYIKTDKRLYSVFDYGTLIILSILALLIVGIEIILITVAIKRIRNVMKK